VLPLMLPHCALHAVNTLLLLLLLLLQAVA
jgi:hypothetical protein